MSTDCLCEYHGRASRDTLWVWSGWASTVIHGPHYEPDLGPRYADSADWSLHTAGPDNPDRATRLQPLARDPAGAGGVAWANQGWIGLKAETTAEPSRNGPGPRFGCIGKYRYIRSLPMSRWDLMQSLLREVKRVSYNQHH